MCWSIDLSVRPSFGLSDSPYTHKFNRPVVSHKVTGKVRGEVMVRGEVRLRDRLEVHKHTNETKKLIYKSTNN